MSATAVADRPRLRTPNIALGRWTMRALGAAAILLLIGISIVERTRAIQGSFWMDEGLSVGIASHPFADIPHLLRQDGSPPLYYLMLHVWMKLFGTTEATTHTLSLIPALLTIPTGLWAGRALFSLRAGWICAVLCTLNPYLTVFGQETRMYSLLTLECMLAATLLVLVFVQRRRRLIPVLGIVLAAALYTHGWAIFYCVGAVIAWLLITRTGTDEPRAVLIDGVLAFGLAGVLFLPWLPTLLEQAAHTAAPWSTAPRFGAPIQISRGLLGGDAPTVALVLAGGFGVVMALRQARVSPERRSVIFLLVLVVAALATAWIASHITPAWTTRYFGIVLGPLLLLIAHGMAKARGLGIIALIVVCMLWANPKPYTGRPKSDLRDIAAAMGPQMKRGDIVVNAQPEQTPASAYYFGPTFRYASPLAVHADPDPYMMDWYDALDDFKRTDAHAAVRALVASLKPGQKVLMIRPVTDGTDNWKAPWTAYIRRRAAQFTGALSTDKSLKRIAEAPPFYRNAREVGNSAQLYVKTKD